jgi:hypothetical protein
MSTVDFEQQPLLIGEQWIRRGSPSATRAIRER